MTPRLRLAGRRADGGADADLRCVDRVLDLALSHARRLALADRGSALADPIGDLQRHSLGAIASAIAQRQLHK